MGGCGKCRTVCAVLLLAFGILFLLQDIGVWDFWGLSWYTVLFLLWGIGGIGQSKCADCQAAMECKPMKKGR